MLTRSFEIKIALLGNVSAGKTTVLNALFRDKYSEVSMKRTTAGINYFRLHSSLTPNVQDDDDLSSSESSVSPMKMRSAKSTLKEISGDNVKLRMGDEVQEKFFDIQLNKDLVPMRKDTKLVVVDVPGINEANVINKYKDYVTEKWDAFDCVIVVMDARLGVNTEDQVSLLNFVKEQCKKKDVPVIILCNKVDDPEDEEQAELVKEARKEVQKIFGVGCREKALEMIVLNKKDYTREKLSPAFIPVSAIHAYIHQSASLMSREAFASFDKDLIEKLGREQIGRRRWSRLSEEKKLDEAFKVIKEGHQDGIKDSNFDKLLAVLGHFLGGDQAQQRLIEQQISTALGALSKHPLPTEGITSVIQALYEKRKLLRVSASGTNLHTIGDLVNSFWNSYEKLVNEAFDRFESEFPAGIHLLAEPMKDLVSYHKLVCLTDWDDTSDHVIEKMKALVHRFVTALLKLQDKDRVANGWDSPTGGSFRTMTKLTPHDWANVWGSFLLLSYNKIFCECFGQEKIVFERLVQDAHHWSQRCLNNTNMGRCPSCKRELSTARGTQDPCCTSCCFVYAEIPVQHANTSRYCSGCQYNHVVIGQQCRNCGKTFQYKKPLDKIAPFAPKYDADGQLLPFQPGPLVMQLSITIPEQFSDTSHVAHIAWKFCDFVESLNHKQHPSQQAGGVTEDSEESWSEVMSKSDEVLVSASTQTSCEPSDGDSSQCSKRTLSRSQKKKAAAGTA